MWRPRASSQGWPVRPLATASAAVAATYGYPDHEHIPRSLVVDMVRRIADSTDLPLSVDLEAGYGDVAATIAATIAAAIGAGAVGANLEDGHRSLAESVDAVETAVRTARRTGVPLVLNARTDVYLHANDGDPLTAAIERGQHFLAAGADCLFVPGCAEPTDIARLVAAFGPGCFSLLRRPDIPSARMLQDLGVARLSHGPYPHRHSLSALLRYAEDAQDTHRTGM